MTMNLAPLGMRVRTLSLQTRIVGLVILIVALVLLLSSYLDGKLSEQAFENDLRDQTINLAKEFASSIAARQILATPDLLQKELGALKATRKNLLSLAVFLPGSQGLVLTASTPGASRAEPDPGGWSQLQEGHVLTSLMTSPRPRIWEVTAPIALQEKIVGALRVRSSLENADRLAARERRQSLSIMAGASVLIVGGLGWYLQHHVNRPIHTLVQTMAQAEAGDLRATARIARHDELGRLAGSFNRMLRKIEQGYDDKVTLMARIENFNRELQAEIERATRELAGRHEELRQVHAQLFALQRQLNRAERLAMAGQLAAMIAHDVSTPLNAISGHAQLLRQKSGLDAEAIDRLTIIEAQIARVVEVLQTLLSASAPAEPKFTPIDINDLVQELLKLIAPVASRQQVAVSTAFASDLPATTGDATQLQQVLLNCLVNAFDAMPKGGVLRIETQRGMLRYRSEINDYDRISTVVGQPMIRTGRDCVVICISDTGVGIAAEDLKCIFEPFFTTKAHNQGTGLGLSICKRIVTAHGGTIEVESRLGAGTTFRIILPGVEG